MKVTPELCIIYFISSGQISFCLFTLLILKIVSLILYLWWFLADPHLLNQFFGTFLYRNNKSFIVMCSSSLFSFFNNEVCYLMYRYVVF